MTCAALLALCALASTGCGEAASEQYIVRGEVLLDGSPLPTGTIGFDPAPNETGAAAAGEIHDGKFEFRSSPGKKIVSIRASRPSKRLGPDGKPDFEQYLPPNYNLRSELRADVGAKPDSAPLKFELKSK